MSDELDRARANVVDTARQWQASRRPGVSDFLRRAMDVSLGRAVTDLDCVERTGKLPPGREWETYTT